MPFLSRHSYPFIVTCYAQQLLFFTGVELLITCACPGVDRHPVACLLKCRLLLYPHGLFDSVLNMCCSCFVFRSRHSLCERCLSVVPVDTNCCVLLGFILRSGLRYALHPSHLPKLGCCRSAPVTWPCWFNIKAKPCLKRCRVPFTSSLCLSTKPCQCSLCSILTPALQSTHHG